MGEQFGVFADGLELCVGDIQRFGNQHPLRGQGAFADPAAQLLVEDPFVEGMLVDDDKAILRLGDDVAVVDLEVSAAEQLLECVGR